MTVSLRKLCEGGGLSHLQLQAVRERFDPRPTPKQGLSVGWSQACCIHWSRAAGRPGSRQFKGTPGRSPRRSHISKGRGLGTCTSVDVCVGRAALDQAPRVGVEVQPPSAMSPASRAAL